jgi:hypothetical protein
MAAGSISQPVPPGRPAKISLRCLVSGPEDARGIQGCALAPAPRSTWTTAGAGYRAETCVYPALAPPTCRIAPVSAKDVRRPYVRRNPAQPRSDLSATRRVGARVRQAMAFCDEPRLSREAAGDRLPLNARGALYAAPAWAAPLITSVLAAQAVSPFRASVQPQPRPAIPAHVLLAAGGSTRCPSRCARSARR